MSAPVFFAESADLSGFAAGSVYRLDGVEGRHAGVVQRRAPGEDVDVVDGDGTRLRCTVSSVDGAVVELLVVEAAVEPRPDVTVTLVQALAKGDRDELAIEAATEVGADAIVPWQAERSIVVWRGDRAARSQARWRATVRTATKQARRARVPDVSDAVTSRGLAALARDVVAEGGVVVVLHEEATVPLADVELPAGLSPGTGTGTGTSAAPRLLVVVGPEGGISQGEVDALCEAGARTARLGPHVLRTSTAGPVAIALLCERLGRWGGV